jgi:hypothetical protein
VFSGGITGVTLVSTVEQITGGMYEYTYTLNYAAGSELIIHSFAVANKLNLRYYDASNSITNNETVPGVTNIAFTNPEYDPSFTGKEIKWSDGVMTSGNTAIFKLRSYYAPSLFPVYAYCQNGGDVSTGEAIGFAPMIPEPATLGGLATALALMASSVFKKRR